MVRILLLSVRKGADRESEKTDEKLRLLSLNWLRRNKLVKLTSKLKVVVSIQIILFVYNHICGINSWNNHF